jgi:hypothetical protein
MVSRTEILAITVAAEEREHQKYLAKREATKVETREYCSTELSELLKTEADKPSHTFVLLVTIPDDDNEVQIIKRDTDSPYYTPVPSYKNFDTLVEFTKEHGFEVEIKDDVYRYNRNTSYKCKKIIIKW